MSDMMERLSGLAKAQLEAEAAIERAELNLKTAKETLRVLSEETIPSVMETLDLKTFTTRDGLKIAVSEVTRAAITKANEAAAFKWLREHGHGRLIKNKVELLPSDELLPHLRDKLNDGGWEYSEKPSIHFQTLGKFVREAKIEGIVLPPSISIYDVQVSKVTVV